MASASALISAFNKHFFEFIDDVLGVFPGNVDLVAAKTALEAIRKANPKLISTIWSERVVEKYKADIDAGNFDSFIDMDYTADLQESRHSAQIMQAIQRIREPVRQMSPENRTKVIKYMQNLSDLSQMIAGRK